MLSKLKIMLGIDIDDLSQDERLSYILTSVTARLKGILGGLEPPTSMEHIIVEVSVIRFNKIGSEGLKSHSVEGESYSFADDDFEAFRDEIQDFLSTQTTGTKGKVRFL